MADITTILKQESNRITRDIHRKMLHRSAWTTLIPQEEFPQGMGYQLNVMTFERSLPRYDASGGTTYDTTGVLWQDVQSSSFLKTSGNVGEYVVGSGATLDPQNNKKSMIEFVQSLKQFKLKRGIVESPRISVNELMVAFQMRDQMQQIVDILAENTNYAWEDRYREEYLRLSGWKGVVTGSNTVSFTADSSNTGDKFNATTGTSIYHLQQEHLYAAYTRLQLYGAGADPLGREQGRPVYGLICSSECSRRILEDDRSGSLLRDDFRESPRVGELLAPLGVKRSFGGFVHLIDELSPRYTWSGGTALARVAPYSYSSGTFDVSSDYLSAEYEVAFVFHMDVFKSLIPRPLSSTPGASFNPQNYRGEFKFLNYPTDTFPDGDSGYFRGILMSGSKPIHPEYGYAILFKRDIFGA